MNSEVSLQKIIDFISDGDRASLDGNFLQAANCYDSALAVLGDQSFFDFERTRDCLNKLIIAHSQLGNKDRLGPLIEQLAQIEGARKVKELQSSAEFFAQRNQPEKARATYLKAFKLAMSMRPASESLLSNLKAAYHEQRNLLQQSLTGDLETETLANEALFDDFELKDDLADGSDETSEMQAESLSAVQKMRRGGFAVASEEKIDPLTFVNLAKAPIFLLVVSSVFLVCAGRLVPYGTTICSIQQREASPESLSGLEFSSCDQAQRLKFTNDGVCIKSDLSATFKIRYSLLSDQLDLPNLFRGYLRRKEFWYRLDGDELVDQNNIVLYQPQAREEFIVEKMWFYARCAQDQFRENRTYPSSAEKSKQIYQNYNYTNPFTGKIDCAKILPLRLNSSEIDLSARGTIDRLWRPGAILCVHKDDNHFYIQGFDHQGKPLFSSDPARYFVIELEYGKCLTKRLPASKKDGTERPTGKALEQNKDTERLDTAEPSIILIDKDGGTKNKIDALRRFPQIVLWFFSLLSFICVYLSKKFKNQRQYKLVCKRSFACCVISLIIFYSIALS